MVHSGGVDIGGEPFEGLTEVDEGVAERAQRPQSMTERSP
jgi:hypothetical protein